MLVDYSYSSVSVSTTNSKCPASTTPKMRMGLKFNKLAPYGTDGRLFASDVSAT